VGKTFEVVGASAGGSYYITVKNLVDGTMPFFGNAVLLDDDHLASGEDVPMPDTSALPAAMAEAFVEVLFDVGTSDDDLPFVRNCGDDGWPEKWDSRSFNLPAYWVT
jgi:hypothetical protein